MDNSEQSVPVIVHEFNSWRLAEIFVSTHTCISPKGSVGCIVVKMDTDGKPVEPTTWTVQELGPSVVDAAPTAHEPLKPLVGVSE